MGGVLHNSDPHPGVIIVLVRILKSGDILGFLFYAGNLAHSRNLNAQFTPYCIIFFDKL